MTLNSTNENFNFHLNSFSYEIQLIAIVFLLILSGLLSGLAIGFMTLSLQELILVSKSGYLYLFKIKTLNYLKIFLFFKILIFIGTVRERLYAETILPLRKLSSSLLCSFIISNVIVNATISILLNNIMTSYIALLCSTTLIVIIGEIIPQAICVKKGKKLLF